MVNVKLIIAYDGTSYFGWQKTEMGPSIEETLQKVLEKNLQHGVYLQAASRTDAGVHATGQVVNFLTPKALTSSDLERLCISLRKLLPKDITVLKAEIAPEDFHPTLETKGKEYRYFVCNSAVQLPHFRLHSWHYYPLDILTMEKAAAFLCGKHDFSSFCNYRPGHAYANYEREIMSIQIEKLQNSRLCFIIRGNNFLYRMARNLVGTLVYIGRGKIKLEDLPGIVAAKDRTQAGISAPAHGLFLHDVFYSYKEYPPLKWEVFKTFSERG